LTDADKHKRKTDYCSDADALHDAPTAKITRTGSLKNSLRLADLGAIRAFDSFLSQYPVEFLFLLVEYSFIQVKLVFSLSHELLLRQCEVCAALFATIVDDMLTLELYKLHKSRMRTIHRPWNRAHRRASQSSRITFLTCGLTAE
jgi:hypothetical protein